MQKHDSAVLSAVTGTRHLSLAFWWAWIWLMFFPGLPDQLARIDATMWWTMFMVASSACAILMLVFFRPLKRVIDDKRLLIPIYLLLAVCTVLLHTLPASPALYGVAILAGALSTPWGAQSISRYSGKAGRELACGTAISLFVAALIYIATIDRPLAVEVLVSALLPLLSVASIYAERSERRPAGGSVTDPLGTSDQMNIFYFRQTSTTEKLQLAVLCICSATFGLFGGIARRTGTPSSGSSSWRPSSWRPSCWSQSPT